MLDTKCQLRTELSLLGYLCQNQYFLAIIIIALTDIAIFLDIPFLRQILGFITLTILPGVFILGILKPDKAIGLLDRSVLSVGLSYSYLIISGLVMNWLYPHLGCNMPLSSGPLVFTISLSLMVLGAFASLRGGLSPMDLSSLRIGSREKAFLVIPSILPLLSILGTNVMNSWSDNSILIILLLLIPAYAISTGLIHRSIPERAYPMAILLISISLVLILGLRSNHLIGADIHNEYYLFSRTINEGLWRYTSAQDPIFGLLEACLSVSILPAIYEVILNIDPELLFKILYPVIFSITPLIVYSLSKKPLPGFYAMLSSLFFMSQLVFLRISYFPRTSIAILFFALSMLVVFHEYIDGQTRIVLFSIFSLSCILSHYATAYLFLAVIVLTWISMRLVSAYRNSIKKNPAKVNLYSDPGVRINLQMILIFSVMAVLWYYVVTGGPAYIGKAFIINIYKSIPHLLSPDSRGAGMAVALGVGLNLKVIPQVLSFAFSWLTVIVLSIGVLSSAFYRLFNKDGISIPGGPVISLRRFDEEFMILSLVFFGSLVASVILPFMGKGYGMDRIYFQMMIVLSTFFVIGGVCVGRCFNIRGCHLILLAVLIPYFLCNVGVVHQAFGIDKEITLNSHGQMYNDYYIHDQETSAAKWIKDVSSKSPGILSDIHGLNILISQGGMQFPIYIGNMIEGNKSLGGGPVFIRYYGAVGGKFDDPYGKSHNISEIAWYLSKRHTVYSNGGSRVLS